MRLLFVTSVLVFCACAVQSTVTRASSKQFEAKPATCNVEFFRTQRPAAPYDEIGAIHLTGGVTQSPEDAQEALRSRACELGADAVVVTDEVYNVPNVGLRVTATAVAYRAEEPKKGELKILGGSDTADVLRNSQSAEPKTSADGGTP